jgi:nicotinamidase-related amidase
LLTACVRATRNSEVQSVPSSDPSKVGLDALLTPDNCALLLIDHQAFQFSGLGSHDPQTIINNVVALAKSAKIFGIPTLLTTVLASGGGALLPALQEVFPDQEPIDRTWINSWEDDRVVQWVEQTGRTKIVIAGLWTEICVAHPTIQALGEGYEVFPVTDASGGVTVEAHEVAIQRMVQAGAVPITWMVLPAELQRDWTRDTRAAFGEMLSAHGGSTGTAFMWEQQLLASGSPS